MKAILIVVLMSLIGNGYSQEHKTYKGRFKEGYAEYSYIQNNIESERIFDGAFTYSASTSMLSNNKIIYNGAYKDNLKSGFWKVKEVLSNSKNKNNKITTEYYGNYNKGFKVGIWNYSINANINGKKSFEKFTFSVKNNLIVGEILFRGFKGKIDTNGLFQGTWTLKGGNYEYYAEFGDNVFKKLITRRIDDGEVTYKYLTDSLLDTKKIGEYLMQNNLMLVPADASSNYYAFGKEYMKDGKPTNNYEPEFFSFNSSFSWLLIEIDKWFRNFPTGSFETQFPTPLYFQVDGKNK